MLEEVIIAKIIDGDTINVVSDKYKKPLRIRLACIDAPELSQSWGVEAKAFLKYIISILRVLKLLKNVFYVKQTDNGK